MFNVFFILFKFFIFDEFLILIKKVFFLMSVFIWCYWIVLDRFKIIFWFIYFVKFIIFLVLLNGGVYVNFNFCNLVIFKLDFIVVVIILICLFIFFLLIVCVLSIFWVFGLKIIFRLIDVVFG